MKTGWQTLPFDKAMADKSGGNLKTPQSEFLAAGRFAVVDQGKQLVSGFVNDESRLCREPLPVVVFGDHTRCFKFVDFPFCMGADGVKVLRPKVEADVKYLYHYLRQLRLYDGGYDRHFKYLKRCDIVLPPLAEQQQIAEVLDRAEALRAKRRAALGQLDTLTQSLFLDLFGDTVSNPKGWPLVPLPSVVYFQEGPGVRNWQFREEGTKLINVGNIVDGRLVIENTKRHLDPVEVELRYKHFLLDAGDFVVASSGVTWARLLRLKSLISLFA